jgi:hypothetical protein
MSGSELPSETSTAQTPSKSSENSVLLDLLPHILRTFAREPALAITICYLLVAMAGIFYNYSYYHKFGIPILTLSQISDFLVAGLQQPMALLLVMSTLPMCWLADYFNHRKRRRREALLRDMPASRWRTIRAFALSPTPRWFTGVAYLCIVVVYGWVFIDMYARHRAEAVKRGDAPQVAVWLNGDGNPLSTQGRPWTYLGAVAGYVFVYDNTANRSVILPVNNVTRIEPLPAADAPAASAAGTLAPIR